MFLLYNNIDLSTKHKLKGTMGTNKKSIICRVDAQVYDDIKNLIDKEQKFETISGYIQYLIISDLAARKKDKLKESEKLKWLLESDEVKYVLKEIVNEVAKLNKGNVIETDDTKK